VAGKKQQKAEKHPKLLGFEELLLISSVPAQDPREKALEKEHHGERFNPSISRKLLKVNRNTSGAHLFWCTDIVILVL
jgi:hypothetical protein